MQKNAKPYSAQNRPDLTVTIAAMQLSDSSTPASMVFYGLSKLTADEVHTTLQPIWGTLPLDYRRKLTRMMADLTESDFELDYREVGLFGLGDADPLVRQASIDMLWEDVSTEVMQRFIQLARTDPFPEVRADALSALGRFIWEGELGALAQVDAAEAQQAALALYNDPQQELLVRRRALEAIGHSSLPVVSTAIRDSYMNGDRELRISALFAMGKSCDNQWEDIVLRELENDDPEIRFEATRAAGEIGLDSAVSVLGRMLDDEDDEIQQAAIRSLGEIGGREAMHLLTALAEQLEDDEDEDLLAVVEEALDAATLAGDDLPLLFSLDDDDFSPGDEK